MPMKKVCSLLLTALIALPLLRCTRDEPAPAPDALQEASDYFDPSEARDHFLQTQRRIRAQHAPDTVGLLPVGTVIPQWEAARPSRNEYLASLDIPVSSPYRYTLLARTDDGGTYPIELHLRLVSIKTPPEDRIAEYLLLFMPDLDYDIRNRGERPWEGLLNSGDMLDFSGLLLYTTLDGLPVCAARFRGGRRTAAAFVGDSTRTPEQNIERLFGIIGPMTIGIGTATQQPERMKVTIPDSTLYGGSIDDVVVIAKKDGKDIPPYYTHDYFQYLSNGGSGRPDNPRPPTDPPGSGNGDGAEHGDPQPGDRIISDKPQVDSLVDQLLEDCMGQVLLDLLESNITVITDNTAGRNSYEHSTRTVYFDAWDQDHAMIVLIEELTHAYQFQKEGSVSYFTHGLNNEIEAKMGWYIYTIRNNINLDLRRYLGGTDGINFFSSLKKYYSSHYIDNLSFNSLYDLVVQKFRENVSYSNTVKYKESSNHRDFKHLDALMKNCIE